MKIAAPATVVRARRRELAKVVTAQAARHADAGHSLRHVWQHLDHRSSFVAWASAVNFHSNGVAICYGLQAMAFVARECDVVCPSAFPG